MRNSSLLHTYIAHYKDQMDEIVTLSSYRKLVIFCTALYKRLTAVLGKKKTPDVHA